MKRCLCEEQRVLTSPPEVQWLTLTASRCRRGDIFNSLLSAMPSRSSPLRVTILTVSASAEGTYRCLEEAFSEVRHPADGTASGSVGGSLTPSGCCHHQIDQSRPAAAAWGKPSILSETSKISSSASRTPHAAGVTSCQRLTAHLSPPAVTAREHR